VSHEPGGRITGRTTFAAVIGDPVRHSRSPQILNAAFEAAGLDWVYVALEVGEGQVPAALEGMRALGIAGLSVTMPHKTAVADYLDRHAGDKTGDRTGDGTGDDLSPEARRLRAVNCVANRGGALTGHNTDGAGFVASLRADAGFDPAGARCVVLGAGGAARALVLALAGAGAADIAVVNRTVSTGEAAAALAGAAGRVGRVDDFAEADLVVNATPVGMDGTSLPIDPARLRESQLVADIVVEPVETPLLREAAARGARTLGGLGMLAHQAAVAFEIWTGRPAPLEAMVAAARQH
jgi:shikimate dehydrogenase